MKKKVLIILICIIFVCTALSTMILLANTEHINHCYVENCPICVLIQTAIHFVKILSYIIEYIALLYVAIPLGYILICRKLDKPQTPLVKLKVRLNN
jgi:hypothetical protein